MARVTGRQAPHTFHLRRGSGAGANYQHLPTDSADEAKILGLQRTLYTFALQEMVERKNVYFWTESSR